MSLKKLDDDIKSGNLSFLYFLYGEEEYDIERYIEKIKKCYKTLNLGINFFVLDKSNIDTLLDVCESVSFFGEQKLVIIKQTGLKINLKVLDNISKSGLVIVIYETSVDKRTTEYKYLQKNAVCVEFEKLDTVAAVSYVAKTLAAYKISVDNETAKYMVEVCGEDKQTLINEFRKIVAFVKENGKLTADIIDKVCVKTLNAKIYDVVDLIVCKKKKEAIEKVQELIDQKVYEGIIISLMFKQIKMMYQLKLAEKNNLNASKELGIAPFIYNKIKNFSRYYTMEQLENLIKEFENYDINVKSGKINSIVGLKQLVLSM